jgi:aspartyl-tRNA(Asn)/glutamyl-tRNA(Gln) amidotransferase subunit B
MIRSETRSKYTTTIGIECHVQLKTATKLFAAVNNDAREAPPNTLVSHICFGMPGALPVLNKEAIYLASKAGFALNSRPQNFSKFDRKHYFYPDLPMGYQITQYDEPIILGGEVEIEVDGSKKKIGITRAHLEADAGKSTHPAGADYSLVDLNRAGTPLLEIVSEPDMHSSTEAKAYVRELWLRMRYADVSEANLYYGNMRFDVNVSVSLSEELGTRTETKNINSFRSVEKVVDFEVNRQIEVLEKGESIIQETRGWDDAKQKTISQRSKENADDYRYMPDPDLPPVILEDSYIADIESKMPIMPEQWREKLSSFKFDSSQVETLLDAQVELNSDFLGLITNNEDHDKSRTFANWVINIEVPQRRELIASARDLDVKDDFRQKAFDKVYELVSAGKLNSTKATALITDLLSSGSLPENIEEYAKDNGYIQVSDENEINKIVGIVIKDNPKAAEDVKNGEMKAIGFLIGQVMKASQGKANPELAQKLIKQQLDI